MTLLDRVSARSFKLTLEELICDGYPRDLKAVQVLTLCNDGTGRSVVTARALARYNIPALYLAGGVNRIINDEEMACCENVIISKLNGFPYVVTILTRYESLTMRSYREFLAKLQTRRHYNGSDSATEGMCRTLAPNS